MRTRLFFLAFATLWTGCEALTREEAKAALEELQISSQASALTSSSVEIATNFTIGDAAQKAAGELRSFIGSQLPCAAITLDDATLTIEYGENPGACTYKGQSYAGTHVVTVTSVAPGEVVVNHKWEAFHNDVVQLDGTATVTWSADEKSRHVIYDATWTRLADSRTGVGTGNVTQTALDEGILSGFAVNGEREWTGKSGTWNLAIEGVEMRWIDPVPQDGRYELGTPFDKSVSAEFTRVSATAIQVTIAGPRRSFDFTVLTLPSE